MTIQNIKLPPAAHDAEAALLAACLISTEAADEAAGVVSHEHFASESHRRAFEAVEALHQANDQVDLVTVAAWLDKRGRLVSVGEAGEVGMAWLTGRMNAAANIDRGSVRRYATEIRDSYILRQTIHVSQRIAAECYQRRRSGGSLIDDVSAYVSDVSTELARLGERAGDETLIHLGPAAKKALLGVHAAMTRGGSPGTSSGLSEYDALTGGFHPGALVVIAGRPAMGKSAIAFGMGLDVAKQGGGFLGFSLEMPDDQVALRATCVEANVDMHKAKSRPERLGPLWQDLMSAANRAHKLPFWIDAKPSVSVAEMRAVVRRVKRECASRNVTLRVVVVDYVQLARAPGVDSREQQISSITRDLKGLAKSENVTVIALSQLNREVEKRADKRPMLADLRESGAIEQDADQVVFVYRDEVYNNESKVTGSAELIVAKHRDGPTGIIHVRWVKETVSFRDIEDWERAERGLPPAIKGNERR